MTLLELQVDVASVMEIDGDENVNWAHHSIASSFDAHVIKSWRSRNHSPVPCRACWMKSSWMRQLIDMKI